MDAHPLAQIGLTGSGGTVENITCEQVILLDEPDCRACTHKARSHVRFRRANRKTFPHSERYWF